MGAPRSADHVAQTGRLRLSLRIVQLVRIGFIHDLHIPRLLALEIAHALTLDQSAH